MGRCCEARQKKKEEADTKREREPEGTTVRGTVSKWSVGIPNPASLTISSIWMLLHLTIYAHCQHSVPMYEAVCPLCSEVENNGVEFGMLDGTFMQEIGASQTCNYLIR